MKIRVIFFLCVIVGLSGSGTYAQKLYTAKDSISLGKDTIIRLTVPTYRGQIQWQRSINGTTWTDVKDGKNDTLPVSTHTEALYRASVTDGTCLPVYSDSALLYLPDTISGNVALPGKSKLWLISDSSQISRGNYVYLGDPKSHSIEIGKVILDEQSGGTIRKITGFVQKGDTLITSTEQATMEDLFINASFKLSTDMIKPDSLKKAVTGADISKALTDAEGFIHPVEITYQTERGMILKSAKDEVTGAFGDNMKVSYDFSGKVFYQEGLSKIWVSKAEIGFTPVYKFEFNFEKPEIDWENMKVNRGELKLFKFWSDDSKFYFNAALTAQISKTVSHEGKPTTLFPNIINANFKFILPNGIPVYISVDCDIMYRLSYDFKGNVKATSSLNVNRYVTKGIKYENKNWSTWEGYRKVDLFTPLDFDAKINTSQKLEVFPHFDIKLYKVLGPWLEVIPYIAAHQNINLLKGSWDANLELGLGAQIGAEINVLGKDILEAKPYYKDLFVNRVWETPDSLGLISGKDQQALCWNKLPLPLVFQVFDTQKQPVAGVPVFFEAEEGSLDKSKDFSDVNGMVSVAWTMPGTPGTKKLTARVINSNEKVVRKGSLSVDAIAKPLEIPVVTTRPVSDISQTTATSGGEVTSDGGSTVIKAGVCWSTIPEPTVFGSNKTTDNSGMGSFSSSLTGLQPGTTYYVRAYATNANGTAYGKQEQFTTKQKISLPLLSTKTVSQVTTSSATGGGNITSDGGAPVTERGICWGTTQNPDITGNKSAVGSGIGSYSVTMTGLLSSTTYYVRAFATSSEGTAYGNQVSFNTLQNLSLPVVTTADATNITATAASGEGNVTSDGGTPVTARGICWSTAQNPTTSGNKTTDGSGIGSFSSSITGLTGGTTYYARAYAINSQGTAYGDQVTFTTPGGGTGTVIDVDGNVYKTVTIGTQTWMAENLKTTKYRDWAAIPNVTDNAAWGGLTTSAYCWYNNDIGNKATYGALYNWNAVNTSKLCPTGWHVPSDAEWTTLSTYLGGESVAGDKMKTVTGWNGPNTGTTNESGFSGLPGGYRGNFGTFTSIVYSGHWWSSTEGSAAEAWYRVLYYGYPALDRSYRYKVYGYSVRCVRD